jgi:hypothetical protein
LGFIYLTSIGNPEQLRKRKEAEEIAKCHCYHHNGMKPQSIGRALGIGLRVAGRIAGERLADGARANQAQGSSTVSAANQLDDAGAGRRAGGRATGRTAGGVARGVSGFLRPFQRVGGILWLEVTGAFFFLFVVVFARAMWLVKESYAYGPGHTRFLGYAALAALFLYLSVSSFWRARRK